MGYSIFWTRRASEDIASIFRFYSTIAGERVARHRLLRIKQDLLCLTTMPHIGHLDKDYPPYTNLSLFGSVRLPNLLFHRGTDRIYCSHMGLPTGKLCI